MKTPETEIEIILIEDDPYEAELTIRALKKSNIVTNIIHLKDGAEAIDFILRAGQYEKINIKPKLILLGLKMRKINEIEVLRKLKSDNITKTIPVVILTSSWDEADINICFELGANGFIVKPVEHEYFTKVISEVGSYWLTVNQPVK